MKSNSLIFIMNELTQHRAFKTSVIKNIENCDLIKKLGQRDKT